MKSFRLYLEPLFAPMHVASDLSPEERTRLREAFRPVVARNRHRKRIVIYTFFGFAGSVFVFMFFGGVLHATFAPWLLVPAFLCWVTFFGLIFTIPGLACPNCNNDIQFRLGRYCPECGEVGLIPAGWFRSAKCMACGKTLKPGKAKGRRNYKIHACTHCGLMLDEAGL